MMKYHKAIVEIQKGIYMKNNSLKTDAHYKEGYGVLFVPMGFPLQPQNIIHKAPIMELEMRSFMP